jgi:hypothetical protein
MAVTDALWLPFTFGTVACVVLAAAMAAAGLSGAGTPEWALKLQDDAPSVLFLGIPVLAWVAFVGVLWMASSTPALARRSSSLKDLGAMAALNRALHAASWPGRQFARLVWVVARTIGKPLLVLTGATGLVGAIGGDYRRGANQYGSWSKGQVTNPMGLLVFAVGAVVTFTFAVVVSTVLLLPILLIDMLADSAHATNPVFSLLHWLLRVGNDAGGRHEADPTFLGMFIAMVALVWLPAAVGRFTADRY